MAKSRPLRYRKISEILAFRFDETNGKDVAYWCGGKYTEEAKPSDTTDVARRVVVPKIGEDGKVTTITASPGDYIIKNDDGSHEVWSAQQFNSAGYEPFHHRTRKTESDN
jgi:hypothetical protein